MNPIRAALATATLALIGAAAHASPVYMPVGAQANVPLATVTGGGWTPARATT